MEGVAEGGDRKVVAAVYFLRLTVHRTSSEDTAHVVVSKQVASSCSCGAHACQAQQ